MLLSDKDRRDIVDSQSDAEKRVCVLGYLGVNVRKARELIISLHRKLMSSFFF